MARSEPKISRTVLNVSTAAIILVAAVVVIVIASQKDALPLPAENQQTVAFSPNGQYAYVASGGEIDVEHFKGGSNTTISQIPVPIGNVKGLAISTNGSELLASTVNPPIGGLPNGSVFIVNLGLNPPQVTQVLTGNVMDSIAIASNGRFALVAESGLFQKPAGTGEPVESAPGTVQEVAIKGSHVSKPRKVQVGYGMGPIAIASNDEHAFVLDDGPRNTGEEITPLLLTSKVPMVLASTTISGRGLLLSPNGATAYVGASVVNLFATAPQVLATLNPPSNIKSLSDFTADAITPNGRFVYLSGGQITGAGGLVQVVEDTSTSPPTTVSFALTDCSKVTLNPQGTLAYCGAGLSYPVVPYIRQMSQNRGGTAGGYPITLYGQNLTRTSTVTFGAEDALVNSVSKDGDSMSVIVPQGNLGPATVTVDTAGGISASVPAAIFTYAQLPAVSGITPSEGLVQGGTGVLLAGSGFAANDTVDFGPGKAAQVTKVSASGDFMAVIAPGGSGKAFVTVTAPGGTSIPTESARYRFVKIAPQATAIFPTSGAGKGGYGLLIGGKYLSGATSVSFGGTAVKPISVSQDGNFLAVTVPPGVGTVEVTVTTQSGSSEDTSEDQFTYTGG